MNIFGHFVKQIHEANLGRIHWQSNMWAVVGSRWDKRRIQNPRLAGSQYANAKGELVVKDHVLVNKMSTGHCPLPPGNDFYKSEDTRERWWVPATECRKCPHHKKAGSRIRFPRCLYGGAEIPKAASQTLSDVNTIFQKAAEKVKDILK